MQLSILILVLELILKQVSQYQLLLLVQLTILQLLQHILPNGSHGRVPRLRGARVLNPLLP